MDKMRLIVAGGRGFTDYQFAESTLTKVLKNWDYNNVTIICGEARGADTIGKQFAIANGIKVDSYPADWNSYGRGAGPIRNAQMANTGTHLLAFWDGKSRGTNNMIGLAKDKGLKTIIIRYD